MRARVQAKWPIIGKNIAGQGVVSCMRTRQAMGNLLSSSEPEDQAGISHGGSVNATREWGAGARDIDGVGAANEPRAPSRHRWACACCARDAKRGGAAIIKANTSR